MRLGEPCGSVMRSRVASLVNVLWTSAGHAVGNRSRYRATAPVTCAAAAEVPPVRVVALSLALDAVGIDSPGANRSTQAPQLESSTRSRSAWMAPTVITPGTRLGEK